MSRPKRDPRDYDARTQGIIALVAWGRLTAAEAGHRAHLHPATIARLCQRLFGVRPAAARRREADRIFAKAENTGRRPLVRFQMQQAADEAVAARAATDLRDPCQPDQPSPHADTK